MIRGCNVLKYKIFPLSDLEHLQRHVADRKYALCLLDTASKCWNSLNNKQKARVFFIWNSRHLFFYPQTHTHISLMVQHCWTKIRHSLAKFYYFRWYRSERKSVTIWKCLLLMWMIAVLSTQMWIRTTCPVCWIFTTYMTQSLFNCMSADHACFSSIILYGSLYTSIKGSLNKPQWPQKTLR